MRRMAAWAVVAAACLGGAAVADVSGFLGSWFNADSDKGGFLGTFIGSDSDNSDISRIVVTQAGANHVRIHLYGRCKPAECDWGDVLAQELSGSPDSEEIRSIFADFNTGTGTKRVTLRRGPGNSLRFDVVTDFNDRSGRHDYETSGTLRFVPAPAVGAATATTPAAVPSASGEPVAAASPPMPAPMDTEDCVRINPEDIYVAPADRGWKVNDFDHTILDFGHDKVAAVRSARVMEFYRFDEQCYIVRPKPKMIYWRVAGQVPRDSMPGQDCVAVDPAKVAVDGAKVVDGVRALVDFGDDAAAARQAASVIRTYRLNRQCFVARPNDKMVYWLSQ